MRRRMLILLAAAVLALLSAAGVIAYANGADQRALAGRKGEWVLLATATIPAGTTAADIRTKKLVRQVLMPAETVPSGALTTLDAAMNAQKLNEPLQPDQMLLRRQFEVPTTPSPTPTFVIPPGKIAVSVDLGIPTQVAGNVKRGDQVTVFALVKVKDNSYPEDLRKFTIVLIPRATVISVGEAAEPAATQTPTVMAEPSGINAPTIMPSASAATISGLARYVVTLAVTQQQAEMLITGAQADALYLGLLGATASVSPAAPAELGSLGLNPSGSA